eukprot:TRINITY_DN14921_c0_g1_i1.p1 TRINITY_DN14921_c0_g1~~TRINITY_DN14921_c0_g1_i1.p1  ORF type:complete len:318 (-),score=55.11 TRINITY_DN14921_c0_g1_i1:92-1045(-)
MMKAVACLLWACVLLHNGNSVEAVQLITHRLHESNVQGRSDLLTAPEHGSHVMSLFESNSSGEVKLEGKAAEQSGEDSLWTWNPVHHHVPVHHHHHFHHNPHKQTDWHDYYHNEHDHHQYYYKPAPMVNKIYLALIVQLGLGHFGIDRCFLGQFKAGTCKFATCGLCGCWTFVDYWVLTVACLLPWKSVDMMMLRARFKEEHFDLAFWISLVGIVMHCFGFFGAGFWNHKLQGLARSASLHPFSSPGISEIGRTFNEIDEDGDGLITWEELKKGYRSLGLKPMSDAQLRTLFARMDANGDGKISYNEAQEFFENCEG